MAHPLRFVLVLFGLTMAGGQAAADPATGQHKPLVASPVPGQATARAKMASPFKYEYVSGTLGGTQSPWGNALYCNDAIEARVLNTGSAEGVAQIVIYGTERSYGTARDPRGAARALESSQVVTLAPQSLLSLRHLMRCTGLDHVQDAYWVKIKVSNEFLLPSAWSVKKVPETQRGEPVQILVDYTVGDFAVYSTEPYRRIW
jgi:hypothetical protein